MNEKNHFPGYLSVRLEFALLATFIWILLSTSLVLGSPILTLELLNSPAAGRIALTRGPRPPIIFGPTFNTLPVIYEDRQLNNIGTQTKAATYVKLSAIVRSFQGLLVTC